MIEQTIVQLTEAQTTAQKVADVHFFICTAQGNHATPEGATAYGTSRALLIKAIEAGYSALSLADAEAVYGVWCNSTAYTTVHEAVSTWWVRTH